jgi:hypothetical protein
MFKTTDTIYSLKSSLSTEENRALNMTNTIRSNREIFSNNLTTNQETKARKQLRARHKVAKIVLCLCLAFFICWLPKQIHDLYW